MLNDHRPISSKVKIKLQPTTCADEATRRIFWFLLEVMEHNAAYLSENSDIAYLHNLRVATRKSRVLLTQATAVFPAEETKRFKRDLKFIGQLSNRLRDLDVYLLQEERQKASLPQEMQADVTLLFAYLRDQREAELLEVVEMWGSEKVRGILEDWGEFLQEEGNWKETAVNAKKPIAPLVRQWIWRSYRRTIKNGRRALRGGAEEQYHQLRIECKKLRYGMEFFSSLFAPAEIEALVTQLKQLQDNLGKINDLHMQRILLLQAREELEKNGRLPGFNLAVIEEMLQAIQLKQTATRESFTDIFVGFANPNNEKAFRLLFKR